jgi:hypothetical protein
MSNLQDYDLDFPIDSQQTGLRRGLTSYGDAHFSLFLRKVFIKAAGYSEDALSRPIVPCTSPPIGGGCEARRPSCWRPRYRVSDHQSPRIFLLAYQHVSPEFDVHGH